MVELESRCERARVKLGRGDFLVADGERLLDFRESSSGFDV